MKKLLLSLSALAILACKQEPKIDYAIVSGSIGETKAKEVTVKGGDFEQKITIGEEGKFTDTLKIAESGFYTLSYGRVRSNLFLKQGDSLGISKEESKIIFSGSGAAENNYLANKRENTGKVQGPGPAFYNLDETAYKAKVEEIKNSHKTTLEGMAGINQEFLAAELKNLEYDSYATLNNYERAHAYYTKNDSFKPSADFLPKALKELTYEDAKAFNNSQAYQNLAFGNVMDPIFEGLDDFNNVKPADLAAISDIKIPALKNQVVDYLAKMALSPANSNLNDMYTFLSESTTDAKIKEDIKANYEISAKLIKGKPSPTFVNYENHKGGATSLNDLKGKYVYVDVWATWCGPCKAEIPSLKKVEKEYHGKNIEFVSTSVDVAEDHGKWVSMVEEKELGGIQLMTDQNWKSQFVKDYGINGIPRFILIDPSGNIVSADAPRPSDPKLKDLFNSLNI
jgi:thiol-disulfide isomerase/thioredoxin